MLRSWPAVFWDGAVITTFCHYVWHFTGPATARQWTAAHPGTFVISLGDAAELARRHAARAGMPGRHPDAGWRQRRATGCFLLLQ